MRWEMFDHEFVSTLFRLSLALFAGALSALNEVITAARLDFGNTP
jgi:hypothetical protein